MKKIIYLFVLVFLCFTGNFYACAEEIDSEALVDRYTYEIVNMLDNETQNILSSFGLEDITTESVFNLSVSAVFKSIAGIFSSNIKDSFSSFLKMLAMLIILIISNGFRTDNFVFGRQLSDIFQIISIIIIASSINDSISNFVYAFDLTGKLLIAYVPILTVLISITGKVTSSILYNSSIVALSQVLSVIANNIIIPFISMYFAFVIALSLNETLNSDRITGSINKAVTTIVSTMTLIFTLLISAKNVLAKDMDGILYKSGKYLISNIVPIIGPTISSILSSIIGSLSLVKSTVAIFAVICVIAINLPVIAGLTANYLSLHIISIISDSFGERQIAGVFKAFASGLKILVTLVIFEIVIVIIVTGLILTIKGEI